MLVEPEPVRSWHLTRLRW